MTQNQFIKKNNGGSGKSDTPPPKPKAPINGNKPVTKGDQLKSLI